METNKEIDQDILIKLAGNDHIALSVLAGMEKSDFKPDALQRAKRALTGAKTEADLQVADAALTEAMHEVHRLHDSKTPSMHDQRTALYTYTFQKLIQNLGKVQFKDHENTYEPLINQKLKQAEKMAEDLGIDGTDVRNRCLSDKYKINVPGLENFKYLDEAALDKETLNLKRTKTIGDSLYYYGVDGVDKMVEEANQMVVDQEPEDVVYRGRKHCREVDPATLQKVVDSMKNQFTNEQGEIDVRRIYDQPEQFFTFIQDIIHEEDRETVMRVATLVGKRVYKLTEMAHEGEATLNPEEYKKQQAMQQQNMEMGVNN